MQRIRAASARVFSEPWAHLAARALGRAYFGPKFMAPQMELGRAALWLTAVLTNVPQRIDRQIRHTRRTAERMNQPHSSRPNCIPELRLAEQNPGFATILAGKPSISGKHPPVRQLRPAGALTVAFGPATPPTRSAPEQPRRRVHRRSNGGVGCSELEYEISKK
jgi:hypothetical protein